MARKMRDQKWRNLKLQGPKVGGIGNYRDTTNADSADVVK